MPAGIILLYKVYLMKLVIATKNKNKINEIKEKFAGSGLDILSLADYKDVPDVIEDGLTFEENAVKKAMEYSAFTGLHVLSDDSGLEVDALSGEPGVRSARYSGETATDDENIDLVLEKLRDVPDGRRNARFICIVAVSFPGGAVHTVKGTIEGWITHARKGNNGFGYDPVFYIPEIGKTMAELTIQEKNKISHRSLAIDRAKELLDILRK